MKNSILTGGPWMASDGLVHSYIDMLAAFMRDPTDWRAYFQRRIIDVDGLVLAGRSGSFLAGFLTGEDITAAWWPKVVVNLDKSHGLPFNGRMPSVGSRVALVDDICVTGTTLGRLRQFAERHSLVVAKELVGYPLMDIEQTLAKRLK